MAKTPLSPQVRPLGLDLPLSTRPLKWRRSQFMERQMAKVNEADFVQLPSSQALQEPILQLGKLRPRTRVSPQGSAEMFRMKTIHGGGAPGPQADSHLWPVRERLVSPRCPTSTLRLTPRTHSDVPAK